MEPSFAALLSPGFSHAVLLGGGFGLLHALDADHLATIGGLAAGNRSLSPAGYALRWACGHAAALGVIAIVTLGLGASGLVDWTSYAEFLVCFALLAIGANALRGAWRQRAVSIAPPNTTIAEHTRAAAHAHVHLLAPFHAHTRSARTGALLGVLHGSAGSAAVLALLPLAHFRSGLESALYLTCFSVGVAIGAIAFAKVFGMFAERTYAAGEKLGAAFQAAIGVLAIASGAWLLFEVVHGGG